VRYSPAVVSTATQQILDNSQTIDLDNFTPGSYRHSKLGVRMSYDLVGPLVSDTVGLNFNSLTLSPYNNSNPDLFIMRGNATSGYWPLNL